MTNPEQIANEIAILRQDSEDIAAEIAEKEQALAGAGSEADASLTPEEATPTPAPASNPAAIPNDQAALIAEINKLEGENKYSEAMTLKTRLLGIQSGFPSQPTPAPANTDATLPTRAELDQQITEAEASGNWSASGALKSRIIQGQYK